MSHASTAAELIHLLAAIVKGSPDDAVEAAQRVQAAKATSALPDAPDAPDLESEPHLSVESEHDGQLTGGRIVKMIEEKRLVCAEIYLPGVEDAHGHSMTAEEIEKMAHGFLRKGRTRMIDVDHDNDVSRQCALVESFVARKGDPDYAEGAWVGVAYIGDDAVWQAIKSGEITGFSFEGWAVLEDT